MRLSDPKVWLAFFSIIAVSALAVVDLDRTSPGALTSVHGMDEALAGKSGCSACHGGWFSGMTDSCLECHAPVAEQLEVQRGMHGVIERSLAERCALCHSEHHGPDFAMVNRQSFAQAGASGPDGFEHEFVGFAMDGRHLELTCAECHEHADDRVLPEGALRFMGLDQDCASCHVDPHEGRMVVACASCHGQSTWDEMHSLGHERLLPLVGGHGDVACRTCHVAGDWHSLEALGSARRRPTPRTCVDCHDSPHAGEFVAGVTALAADTTAAQVCVDCHVPEHESFRADTLSVSDEQHAVSGFPLDAPHADVTCAGCHAPGLAAFDARYPGRAPEACSACHADVHGGQFAAGPFAGRECTVCHDRLAFEPHAFRIVQHEVTALPLDGQHLDTECRDCHLVPREGQPRQFHGTPSDCDACHSDVHRGFFDPLAAALPEVEHGDCARCHVTRDFHAVAETAFDHETWTRFPLLGAHEQEACEACHPARPEPDERGRTFGRVAEHFGTFDGCRTCHADPHDGQFDAPGQPIAVAGRTGCARCHVETSFRSFPSGFEHARWTGFTLAGAHDTECSACHEPLAAPDAGGCTWRRAAGAGCADCHVDPHAGQFAEEGATECARCHTSSRPDFLSFDHERDARFALGDSHRGLACDACHETWETASGFDVVRYRPLGIECSDCHGVHEDVLSRRGRRSPR